MIKGDNMPLGLPESHYIGRAMIGRKCSLCSEPASHKISEDIPPDDPAIYCRPCHISFVCCEHFKKIMGPSVSCQPKHEAAPRSFVESCISFIKEVKGS